MLRHLAIGALTSLLVHAYPDFDDSKYFPTSTNVNAGNSTKIESSDTFASCSCDLTKGSCDEACCCDTDCAPDIVNNWRLRPDFCLDE